MENKPDPSNQNPATPKPELKKGLGRGLAALLGGDDDAPYVKTQPTQSAKTVALPPVVEQKTAAAEESRDVVVPGYRIFNVAIDKVHANEEQPRQHFSDAKLQELAESICEQGLIQPIIVRKGDNQSYQIVAGERRWRACKMLGMVEIPVIIRDEVEQVDNFARADLASVIENIQRVELNAVELAEAYGKILKTYNFTQDELAKKLGVSRVSVANTLRLQRLPETIKDAIVQGRLSEGHARALLTLERTEDMTGLAQEIIDFGLNVREVEAKVRAKIQGPAVASTEATKSAAGATPSVPKELTAKDPETIAAEDELRNIFGTKVMVRGNAKGGTIELYYSNEDSLHRLLHQLRSARSSS